MSDELIKYVLNTYPHTNGNNTEICIYVWEEVAKRMGVQPTDWLGMKSIMRKYKPETITRARRDLVKSTEAQREKAEEFRQKYSSV